MYLAVLQSGRLAVSEAAERAYVSRTNAYDVAKRLVHRGLLQVTEVSGGDAGRAHTLLTANDPALLLQDLAEKREVAQRLIPQLHAIRSKGSLPRVRYLEGVAGIRTALFESLEWESPIRGILSMSDLIVAPGEQAMAEYIQGRRERGLLLRVVRSEVKEAYLDWPTSETDLRDVRLALRPYVFTMTTLIGRHTVSTLSSHTENFAMVIESSEFAEQQQHLFEILWSSSPPHPGAGHATS